MAVAAPRPERVVRLVGVRARRQLLGQGGGETDNLVQYVATYEDHASPKTEAAVRMLIKAAQRVKDESHKDQAWTKTRYALSVSECV